LSREKPGNAFPRPLPAWQTTLSDHLSIPPNPLANDYIQTFGKNKFLFLAAAVEFRLASIEGGPERRVSGRTRRHDFSQFGPEEPSARAGEKQGHRRQGRGVALSTLAPSYSFGYGIVPVATA